MRARATTDGLGRRSNRLRLALLVALVVAVGALAVAVVTQPGRVGLFPGSRGRTASPGEAGWVRLSPAPIALTEVAVTAHEGHVWVAGGLDGTGAASARVLVYDPSTDAWSEGPRLLSGVHHASLVSDGSTLWLLGGYAGPAFDQPTAEVWRLDADATTWVRDTPLPEARGAGAAAWDGVSRIVYGGGVGADGRASDVVFMSDPAAGWVQIARLRVAREHLAATTMSPGFVMFIGGRRSDAGNLGTVEWVGSDAVVGGAEDIPTPRGGVAAFEWGSYGECLVGGEDPNGTFGDVECVGAIDQRTLPGLVVPRHGLGAAVIDGVAYVVLGGPRPGLSVSDVVEALRLPRP